MFDWLRFCDSHNIEYVTSGHNVRPGNAGVRCPFCGDDPSHHMGLSLYGRGWHCWRCERAGKAPQPLIVALIGCSYSQANAIAAAEDTGFVTTEESFRDDAMRKLFGNAIETTKRLNKGTLKFLDEFVPLRYEGRCRILVYPYLEARGYTRNDISELSERFQLMFAPSGRYAYRIIIPVFMKGKLVTWTARTVSKLEGLRYKTLSHNQESAIKEDTPPALMNIKDCIFDYDSIKRGGEVLIVCEGPFDAMRITFFGEEYGIRATAVFGKRSSVEQSALLYDVSALYKERHAIFDKDSYMEFYSSLPEYLDFRSKKLLRDVKDPAELTFSQFKQLFGLDRKSK